MEEVPDHREYLKMKAEKLLKDRKIFLDKLKQDIMDYTGRKYHIVKKAPLVFKTLVCLLESELINGNYKVMVRYAIAYFIQALGEYPESKYGPEGFLDDIYLSVIVFKEIVEEYGFGEVERCWDGDAEDLKKLLKKEFNDLEIEFGASKERILIRSGIKYLLELHGESNGK